MTKSHYFSVFPFDKSEYFRVVLIRKNCIEGPLYIFLEACYSLAPTNFNLDWKLIITSLQFDTLTFSILLIVTCSILLLVHGFCSHPGKGSRGLFSRCGILVQSLTDLTPHCQVFFFFVKQWGCQRRYAPVPCCWQLVEKRWKWLGREWLRLSTRCELVLLFCSRE